MKEVDGLTRWIPEVVMHYCFLSVVEGSSACPFPMQQGDARVARFFHGTVGTCSFCSRNGVSSGL